MRILVAALVLCGCELETPKAVGEECSVNSDCDAPLVCRVNRCRTECATSRDCALGLDCVLDEFRLGGCQVNDETVCMINSDCTQGLVCRESRAAPDGFGRCVNECSSGRDCAPGQICCPSADETLCPEATAELPPACIELDQDTCVYNEDCSEDRVCASDGRCRLECREAGSTDDCLGGEICARIGTMEGGFSLVCSDPLRIDAGTGADAGL